MPETNGRLGSRRRVGTREEEKARAVRLVRQLRKELGTEPRDDPAGRGSARYAASSRCGRGSRQADIDDGVEAGGDDGGGRADQASSSRRTASCVEPNEILKRASAFFAAELDRPSR